MKFWKNLAVCSTLALSCIAFNGCNCSGYHPEVSVDLDNDGVISDWETIFDKMEESNRVIGVSNIVDISSFEQLKAINDTVSDVNYYKLTKNIDCGGEELNINLGKSVLLGNNKVIKNFKLKEIGYTTGEGEDKTHIDANVYGFIYNGVAVYDLRLFAGYQQIEINDLRNWNIASTLINVATVDNVVIKGKLEVNRLKTEGLSGGDRIDLSLGVASLSDIGEMISDGYYTPNISNISAIGEIKYGEEMTNSRVRIGGIIPHLGENGMVYGATSNVNIDAYSTGTLSVGGIVADNEDLVSTCEYLGTISTTYDPNSSNFVGGIAGRNLSSGEIKNSIVSGKITFNTSTVTSTVPKFMVGGVVGRNIGVVDYVENNATIDITNAYEIQIGGICGTSEYGIFSNIINRAKITLNSCKDVYIAEITGVSKYGHYEKIVDMSTITINNGAISSRVKLGMDTIFEDFSNGATNLKYNAEFTPTFTGILMTGNAVVNQKKVTDTSTNFVYNLGLRNPYEYEVIDEATGLPKTEVRTDGTGKPILDENDQEILDVITATSEPDLYTKLFYLSDSYSIKKYSITSDDAPAVQDVLAFTFAKDSSKSDFVAEVSSTRLLISFFVRDLGFKYGLNHNEIDLSGNDSEVDLNKIKFTLSTDKSLEKYFEAKTSNGELKIFDSYIDEELNYDADKDKYTEMYSYLNSLLLSNTTKAYKQLKVSYKFASCMDPNNSDSSIKLENNFARNISHILGLIVGVNPSITELDAGKKDITESNDNLVVRYEKLEVSDSNYRYTLTFNVTQMISDNDSHLDNYVVYLQYAKVNKY